MAQPHACKDFEQDLVLYHYGDCVPADKQRIESHLEGCDACRGFLQELKAFLPSTLAVDEPPPSFWQDYSREMRIKLSDYEENRRWWRSLAAFLRPWPVPALAAGAIIAISLTMTFNKSPEAPPRDPEYAYMASNADFFKSMDLLDSIGLLESVEPQETQKGEASPQNL